MQTAANSAVITALAVITGSLVGALGSAFATWITARHQDRRVWLAKQIALREALYSDFIGESARLLVDAMQHNAGDSKNATSLRAAEPHPAQFLGARSARS